MSTVKLTWILLAVAALCLAIFGIRHQTPTPLPPITQNCNQASSSYIGLSESVAISRAKSQNLPYRIVARDGEDFPVTMDYQSERINFEIAKDKVAKANCG